MVRPHGVAQCVGLSDEELTLNRRRQGPWLACPPFDRGIGPRDRLGPAPHNLGDTPILLLGHSLDLAIERIGQLNLRSDHEIDFGRLKNDVNEPNSGEVSQMGRLRSVASAGATGAKKLGRAKGVEVFHSVSWRSGTTRNLAGPQAAKACGCSRPAGTRLLPVRRTDASGIAICGRSFPEGTRRNRPAGPCLAGMPSSHIRASSALPRSVAARSAGSPQAAKASPGRFLKEKQPAAGGICFGGHGGLPGGSTAELEKSLRDREQRAGLAVPRLERTEALSKHFGVGRTTGG